MCKRLKAYKISCADSDHGSHIRFAEKARRLRGYSPSESCDCEYIDVSIKRALEFDQYSPGPVTVRQYLEHGWYWECSHCSSLVYGDSECIVVDKTGHVFCGRECMQKILDSYGEWNPETMHESVRVFIEAVRECLESLPAVETA